MWSQTVGAMSMGMGVTYCRSIKQKLNTKSSTGLALVDASDYVPYNICYIILMHHQWYLNKPNRFFQKNQITMSMEINGRNSCIGNSWNKNIIYFFIKDWVEKVSLSIMYCPTHLMLADYFIEPLQGYLI